MAIGLGDVVAIKGTDARGIVTRIRTEYGKNYNVIKVYEVTVTDGKMKGKTIQARRLELMW
jgi:hypothetical protein